MSAFLASSISLFANFISSSSDCPGLVKLSLSLLKKAVQSVNHAITLALIDGRIKSSGIIILLRLLHKSSEFTKTM